MMAASENGEVVEDIFVVVLLIIGVKFFEKELSVGFI